MHLQCIHNLFSTLLQGLHDSSSIEKDSDHKEEQSDDQYVDEEDTSQETRLLCRQLGRHYRISCTSNSD